MKEKMENLTKKTKKIRKITKNRLKNIALYYLQRFDSSVDNLRQVLKNRVYNYAQPEDGFDKKQAFDWIEEILTEFEELGYLDDKRYAEFKIKNYLMSGKPERYIKIKLQQKGVDSDLVNNILDNEEYDIEAMALKYAEKKKIGPFRTDSSSRKENRSKDMAAMIRAGFDYDTSKKTINIEIEDD